MTDLTMLVITGFELRSACFNSPLPSETKENSHKQLEKLLSFHTFQEKITRRPGIHVVLVENLRLYNLAEMYLFFMFYQLISSTTKGWFNLNHLRLQRSWISSYFIEHQTKFVTHTVIGKFANVDDWCKFVNQRRDSNKEA